MDESLSHGQTCTLLNARHNRRNGGRKAWNFESISAWIQPLMMGVTHTWRAVRVDCCSALIPSFSFVLLWFLFLVALMLWVVSDAILVLSCLLSFLFSLIIGQYPSQYIDILHLLAYKLMLLASCSSLAVWDHWYLNNINIHFPHTYIWFLSTQAVH